MTPRVAVVGGGAVGVTVADDLATRGATVALFERETVGSGSSGRAAGILYDAYAEDVDAELAARSMARFAALSGPGAFPFTDCPYAIVVREDDADADAVPAMASRMRQHGRDVTTLDPDDLGARFPLETDDLAIAVVADGAGYTDAGAYTEAMADRAREAGATIRERTPVAFETIADGCDAENSTTADAVDVLDLDPPTLVVGADRNRTETFDAVVVAAGAHTKRVFGNAGVPLAVTPYRVQALTSRAPYDGPMVYDATAGVYFRPHATGLLAGDGVERAEADPDAYDREADDRFVATVTDALAERADYRVDLERAWAGLCTATPDGDPLLGEVAPGVFVGAGWQGRGLMRAPAHAEVLAEAVLERAERGPAATLDVGVDHFDPKRFDGGEEIDIGVGLRADDR